MLGTATQQNLSGSTVFTMVYQTGQGGNFIFEENGTPMAQLATCGKRIDYDGTFYIRRGYGGPPAFLLETNSTALFTADIAATTAGNGLQIAGGANARVGSGTLVAGAVTVSNTSISANAMVFLQITGLPASLSGVGQLIVILVPAQALKCSRPIPRTREALLTIWWWKIYDYPGTVQSTGPRLRRYTP